MYDQTKQHDLLNHFDITHTIKLLRLLLTLRTKRETCLM